MTRRIRTTFASRTFGALRSLSVLWTGRGSCCTVRGKNDLYDLPPWTLRIALKARAVGFSFLSSNLKLLYLSTLVTFVRDVHKAHRRPEERLTWQVQQNDRNNIHHSITRRGRHPHSDPIWGTRDSEISSRTGNLYLQISNYVGRLVLCKVSVHIPTCLSLSLGHGRNIWNRGRSYKCCANRFTWANGKTCNIELHLSKLEPGRVLEESFSDDIHVTIEVSRLGDNWAQFGRCVVRLLSSYFFSLVLYQGFIEYASCFNDVAPANISLDFWAWPFLLAEANKRYSYE